MRRVATAHNRLTPHFLFSPHLSPIATSASIITAARSFTAAPPSLPARRGVSQIGNASAGASPAAAARKSRGLLSRGKGSLRRDVDGGSQHSPPATSSSIDINADHKSALVEAKGAGQRGREAAAASESPKAVTPPAFRFAAKAISLAPEAHLHPATAESDLVHVTKISAAGSIGSLAEVAKRDANTPGKKKAKSQAGRAAAAKARRRQQQREQKLRERESEQDEKLPRVFTMPKGGIQGLVLRERSVTAASDNNNSSNTGITVSSAAVAEAESAAAAAAAESDKQRLELEALTDSLNASRRAVLGLALRGYSLFLGGDAGTGKSFLLKIIVAHLQDRLGLNVAVTGSTGIAALNIGGVTFHSLFGIGIGAAAGPSFHDQHHHRRGGRRNHLVPSSSSPQQGRDCRRPPKPGGARARLHETLRGIDVLVVDEVSMLSARDLAGLEAEARAARGGLLGGSAYDTSLHCGSGLNSSSFFGGIQVIFTGDFMQLKAIESEDPLAKWRGARSGGILPTVPLFASPLFARGGLGAAPFAPLKKTPKGNTDSSTSKKSNTQIEVGMFSGGDPSAQSGGLVHVRLTETMRQASDPTFLEALNKLRVGELTPMIQQSALRNPFVEGATRLFARRADADRHNAEMMAQLDAPAVSFATKVTHAKIGGNVSDVAIFDLSVDGSSSQDSNSSTPVAALPLPTSIPPPAAAASASSLSIRMKKRGLPLAPHHHLHHHLRTALPRDAFNADAIAEALRETASALCVGGGLAGLAVPANRRGGIGDDGKSGGWSWDDGGGIQFEGGTPTSGGGNANALSPTSSPSLSSSSVLIQPLVEAALGLGRHPPLRPAATFSGAAAAPFSPPSPSLALEFYVVQMPSPSPPPSSRPSSNAVDADAASPKGGKCGAGNSSSSKSSRVRYSVRCAFRGVAAGGEAPPKAAADALLRAVLRCHQRGGGGREIRGASAMSLLSGRLSGVRFGAAADDSSSLPASKNDQSPTAATSTKSPSDPPAANANANASLSHDVSKRIMEVARGAIARDSTLGQKVLKVGGRVMLLRNLSPSLVNGRQGVVIGMEEIDPHSEHFAQLRGLFRRVRVYPPTQQRQQQSSSSPASSPESAGEKPVLTDGQPQKKMKTTKQTRRKQRITPQYPGPLPFTRPFTILVPTSRALSPWHLNVPVPIVRFDDGTTSYIPYVQLPMGRCRDGGAAASGGADDEGRPAAPDPDGKEEAAALPPPPPSHSSNIAVSVATVPLVPAYAFTIHKIQGLTLSEPVIVDCRSMWPCEHIIYVAASRVRTYEHLRIVGLRKELVVVDKEALRFTQSCPTVAEAVASLGLQMDAEGRLSSSTNAEGNGAGKLTDADSSSPSALIVSPSPTPSSSTPQQAPLPSEAAIVDGDGVGEGGGGGSARLGVFPVARWATTRTDLFSQ